MEDMGLRVLDPAFEPRVILAYDAAMTAGKYLERPNIWARENHKEYWAEAVQSYYNVNNYGPIDTRAELLVYDNNIYMIVAEIFSEDELPAKCPT